MYPRLYHGVVAAMLVLAASCANEGGGQWENPKLSWENWNVDRDECRQLASERAEQELALAQSSTPTIAYSRTGAYQQSTTRFDAGRVRERLFARCMTDRGYRLVPREN